MVQIVTANAMEEKENFYSNYMRVQVCMLMSNKVEIIKIGKENTKFLIPIKFACKWSKEKKGSCAACKWWVWAVTASRGTEPLSWEDDFAILFL